MVNVRPQPHARLNVLLTEDRPQAPEHWVRQLPRLLEPLGVAAYVAGSGQEAIDLVERVPIHAAVIDLGTPVTRVTTTTTTDPTGQQVTVTTTTTTTFRPPSGSQPDPGLWLLELFRRLPNRPPVVVLRSPAFSAQQVDRLLAEALRLGAFSVLNKPVDLETMLAVFRRLLDRRYRGAWPGSQPRN